MLKLKKKNNSGAKRLIYRKKSTEALVADSKEVGLLVNADKTKYMVMSRDQNARCNHNTKTGGSLCERWKSFKSLGTTLTYQNSIKKEIKIDRRQGMFTNNRCRKPFLPVLYSRI